jgi:Na+/proline symporter
VALVTIKGLGGDDPDLQYNNAIPLLMNEYLPNGMLGLALAGLIAAFMAGVAANVSAFNTVVTYDLGSPTSARDARTSTTCASAGSPRSAASSSASAPRGSPRATTTS